MCVLPLPSHKESSQGITFLNLERESEIYDGRSKQLAGE
jgi:hypothetical protein